MGRAGSVAAGALLLAACSPPPSVKAVDRWLDGYAAADSALVVANTWPGDRALVARCLAAVKQTPTSSLALALPPLPLSHEILELEDKPTDDRHIVLTKVTSKNPLPYEAERVGQQLGDIPKTRSHLRRFLAVRTEEGWGVKLDLATVLRRAAFAERFIAQLEAGDIANAEASLADVPPPPDEANALKRSDRLVETLREELATAKKRRTKTSTTAR